MTKAERQFRRLVLKHYPRRLRRKVYFGPVWAKGNRIMRGK